MASFVLPEPLLVGSEEPGDVIDRLQQNFDALALAVGSEADEVTLPYPYRPGDAPPESFEQFAFENFDALAKAFNDDSPVARPHVYLEGRPDGVEEQAQRNFDALSNAIT